MLSEVKRERSREGAGVLSSPNFAHNSSQHSEQQFRQIRNDAVMWSGIVIVVSSTPRLDERRRCSRPPLESIHQR